MHKLKKTTRILKSERVRMAERKASRGEAKSDTKDGAGSKHGDDLKPNHDRESPPIKKSKKDRENNPLKKENSESDPAKVKKVKHLDMKAGTVMSIKTTSDNLNKKDIKVSAVVVLYRKRRHKSCCYFFLFSVVSIWLDYSC